MCSVSPLFPAFAPASLCVRNVSTPLTLSWPHSLLRTWPLDRGNSISIPSRGFNRNCTFLFQQNGPLPSGSCPALVGEHAFSTQLALLQQARLERHRPDPSCSGLWPSSRKEHSLLSTTNIWDMLVMPLHRERRTVQNDTFTREGLRCHVLQREFKPLHPSLPPGSESSPSCLLGALPPCQSLSQSRLPQFLSYTFTCTHVSFSSCNTKSLFLS